MGNSIVVSVEFDYRGEHFSPTATIDLDAVMQEFSQLPDLLLLLARANDINDHSYELEIMMMEPLQFSDCQGWVCDYVYEGGLDVAAFETAWHERSLADAIATIARRTLQVDDLEQRPELRQALLEAYDLGKAAVSG
jgi:hypothetical protein